GQAESGRKHPRAHSLFTHEPAVVRRPGGRVAEQRGSDLQRGEAEHAGDRELGSVVLLAFRQRISIARAREPIEHATAPPPSSRAPCSGALRSYGRGGGGGSERGSPICPECPGGSGGFARAGPAIGAGACDNDSIKAAIANIPTSVRSLC